MTIPERVLILDGHTNQALACVRSLGRAGYRVLVSSHQRFSLGTWSRYCRKSFRLANQSMEAFRELREWASGCGVTIVLPLTERSCVICNAERPEWERLGISVGCGPAEMLESAFDKAETVRRAVLCGLSIPPTRFPRSLDEAIAAADEVGFPCVVKPRRSNAWDGETFLPQRSPAYVLRREDVREAVLACRQNDEWPLVQGYVEGKGKGVFALCDKGRAVAWFAHERLRDARPTGSGSSLRRSIPLDARLREPARRLLAELKWHGPVMVEFKDDGVRDPCLMEVNGRFWGSLQLGIDAGIDFPQLWAAIIRGREVEESESYRTGFTLRWLWGDVKRFLWIVRGAPRGYPGSFPNRRQGLKELFGPQPAGTRLEVWRSTDPWPAVGELVQGTRDLWERVL